MEQTRLQSARTIGWLLIAGAAGVLIPYTILTIIFDYPNILRLDTAIILTRFHQGGNGLTFTWFAFAVSGLPLLPAYILIGQRLEERSQLIRSATTIGVISLIVQMVGLLRWTFVVPMLADSYVQAADEATKSTVIIAFKTIHQFGGVLLGEHLGQLFTVAWTVMVSVAFARLRLMPMWVNLLGLVASFIYFLAQASLFATVIPGLPVISLAGFLGSTLWLLWLIIVGVNFVRKRSV